MKKTKLTYKLKPHALNKTGNNKYCIFEFRLFIDDELYFNATSLYSEYILGLPKQSSIDLLNQVINELANKFLKRFENENVEKQFDIEDIRNKMIEIRDSSKKVIDS